MLTFTNVMSLQGIIRIAICVVALLPASARFRFFLPSLIFAHRHFTSQVFIYLNLNGMFRYLWPVNDSRGANLIPFKIPGAFNVVSPCC